MLKRFTTGRGGSDVLVVRPRLRDPVASPKDHLPQGIISQAWGAYLVVKTGKLSKAREEWDRFNTYLADRAHPFMARSQEFLEIVPASPIPNQETIPATEKSKGKKTQLAAARVQVPIPKTPDFEGDDHQLIPGR